MKMKRVVTMLIALMILITGVMAGCSKKDDEGNTSTTTGGDSASTGTTSETSTTAEGESAKQDPITFTVFIGSSYQQPTKDNKIYKMIEDELNVTFEFEFLVGDLEQKLGVMIASGDYPDIVDSANSTERSITSGMLLPLNDYLSEEKTPNIMKHYDGMFKQMAAEDGNIYVLPNYGVYYNEFTQISYMGPAFWIQKAVVKELGYPEIKTLDQYFDAIAQYKEKYPEINGQPTVGFEVLSYDWRAFCLKNAPAQLLGNPNDGGVIVDPATSTASLYANTDGAKKYYQKLNQAFNDGLIEADTFVQNYDEYIARISSGRVLGMFDQGWNHQTATDSLKDQGLFERTYIPLGITYDESITPYYRDRPVLNINRGFGISTDCKDPERFVQVMETLLSERWQKILAWGIEGEDYLVDENGIYYRTEEMRVNQEDTTWKLANKAEALYASLPKIEGTYDDGNAATPGEQPSEYKVHLEDIDREILEGYGIDYFVELLGDAPENRKDYPAWSIPLGDGTEAAVADKKISELQVQYLPQLILNNVDKFDAEWDKYVKEYDSVNVEAYLETINAGIQDRISKW